MRVIESLVAIAFGLSLAVTAGRLVSGGRSAPVQEWSQVILAADIPQTSWYIDGRFVGWTREADDVLKCRVRAGAAVEVRATVPLRADLDRRLAPLQPGESQRWRARFGEIGRPSETSSTATVGPGSTLRLLVPPKLEDGKNVTLVRRIHGFASGDRLTIVVNTEPFEVRVLLHGPDGEVVPAESERFAPGVKGKRLLHHVVASEGPYELRVSQLHKDTAAPVVLRVVKNLPLLAAKDASRLPDRRLPPTISR